MTKLLRLLAICLIAPLMEVALVLAAWTFCLYFAVMRGSALAIVGMAVIYLLIYIQFACAQVFLKQKEWDEL